MITAELPPRHMYLRYGGCESPPPEMIVQARGEPPSSSLCPVVQCYTRKHPAVAPIFGFFGAQVLREKGAAMKEIRESSPPMVHFELEE